MKKTISYIIIVSIIHALISHLVYLYTILEVLSLVKGEDFTFTHMFLLKLGEILNSPIVTFELFPTLVYGSKIAFALCVFINSLVWVLSGYLIWTIIRRFTNTSNHPLKRDGEPAGVSE